MRKIVYLIALFCTSFLYAQTSGITYQAVIYHPNGQNIPGVDIQKIPMSNKSVCLQFSLIDNLSQIEYQEVIQTTTDEFGMVNLIIGTGNQTGGYASSFNAIVWNANTKKLKVQLDVNGTCQQFIVLSDNPLSAVPFAYAAVTANSVSGVVEIQNGGTGASNLADAKINLQINNVDNTSDINKPISIATQTALDTKENIANKSTNTTLGTSDVLFPTQNAVKTYVDAQVTTATIVDADATTKGKIKLAGDLGGTADLPTVPGLVNKENSVNKSTATTLGTSDVLFPTQNAVKTYVDAQVASATIADADAVTKGKIKLAGDLGGTADLPTVPGLANKENSVNKSTATTLGTSDVLFPTQNAVKTYVDAQVASATIADADAVTKGKIKLAGDLGGTADLPTVPGLANKENSVNKSTATTLGTSDVLFPTQNAVKTYVDAQVASATIADADAVTKGKIKLAGDLGGTADLPTVPGLANKENSVNKSTATTLGTSDVLYPTQNAVKTYVDTNITAVNNTVTANASAATNAIAAVQADVDANEATGIAADIALQNNINILQNTVATNATNTTTALALKEDAANKSAVTTLGTSDVLFPTQNAVKTYVDAQVASATIADADATTKGKIQLAGDLGGTAAAPTVPGLLNKENTIPVGTSTQYFRGDKTWQTLDKSAVGLNNVDNSSDADKPISNATQTALNTKEDVVNKSTDVSIDGTSDLKYPSVKATKDYVDSQIATGVVDASTSIKGKVQLAGDLTGTAALPEVATGAITTAKLADNAVETAKIKNANVTNAKLDKANIPLSGFGAATADVDLGSNKLTNVTDPASAQDAATKNYVDTATSSITTLTDGKIYVGNASNEATQVTPTGDVTITNAGVTAIGTGKVVTAMLADTAVTTAKITDANVTTAKLADNAVETAKIKNANVTNAKLDKANIPLSGFGAATADVDLGSNKLTNVTDPASAQDAATKNYVDTATSSITTLTDGKIYVGNASNEATQVTPTGDVTITNAGVTAIGTGKVVTAMLADTAVTTAKITDANVTTAKLADNAVETAKIKNANVTNAKLDKANIPLSGFGAATADVDLGSNKLTNVTDPASAQDAATKNYVDTATSSITTLTDGKIYVGNASNEATQVTPTGDVTITNAGVTAIGTGKVVTAMLADTAVTTAKITDANVTTAKLADNAVETAKIKNANVTNAKLDKANIPLSGFGAATADVDLGSNKLTNVTDPASAQDAATKNYVDTATSSITTLTDGKIYVGNASNEATQVTPTGDVTITNAGVTAIGTGKVVTAMLADTAVTTAKITDANVTTAKLADNAVETAKIKNANVTNAKLDKANIPLSGFGAATADVDLGSNKLTNVTDPASAQDAATKNYVDTATSSITTLTDGKIYVGNASNEATQVTPTGDVTITNAGVTAIGTGKVVTAMLADTAVTTAKITDANVTTAKLADDAVETAKIKNAAVTTAKIADANVTYAKIQNVSATDKVLGRVSTGSGVIEEISTTGSGNVVRATSPTLVTPDLGTPSAIDLTNATGLPIATAVTGILDVANGGTGSNTQNFVDLTTNQTIGGIKDFTSNATFNGQSIGKGNASGGDNLAVGAGAMNAVSTGVRNTAIGNSAMQNYVGTSFDNNTSVGYANLVTLTTGSGNTSVGAESMMALTTGSENTSIGNQSLINTTGSNNVGVGKRSGDVNTTGNNNTIIGTNANLVADNLNNATALGYGAVVGSSDTVQLGNTNVTSVNTSGKLTTGAVTYPNTDGTVNQVLLTNGSGVASFGPIPTLNQNTTGTAANVTGTVAIANGGTGQTTKTAAFDALSPMTASGDIIYGGTSGTGTRLAKGTDGQVLTLASGLPSWASPAGVTTLAAIGSTPNANGATISGSTLNLQPADATNGGVLTSISQTIGGAKTFNSNVTVNGYRIGKGAANVGSNIAFGESALNNSSASGFSNVAIGSSALTALSTGGSNIAIGTNVLKNLTTGDRNLGIGADALSTSITGSDNTAIGHQSLMLATGAGNTALGSSSGAKVTTGGSNVILGNSAATNLTTGSSNVAIGSLAGSGTGVGGSTLNQTGSNSVFIGRSTQPQNDGQTNQVVISGYDGTNANSGLGSNTTLIGNSATTLTQLMGALNLPNTTASSSTTTGALRVGGGAGIAGNVYIGGTLSIAGGTPAAGDVLTSDANGLATWSAPTGITTMTAIGSTPNANGATISGVNLNLEPASANFGGVVTTGTQTFAGAKTFSNDISVNENKFGRGAGSTGSRNIAIGINPLNSNTTGIWNTAVGAYSLQFNTTSSSNTAIGNEAISNAIPGNNNTGIGNRALMNTTGSSNTAVGSNALLNASTGVDNTAIGKDALQGNTTGSNNIGIGVVAGANTTTGEYNIAIGKQALQQNITGSTNIAIGAGAIDFITTGNYNTVLGGFAGRYAGTGTSTNTTTLNNSMLLGYDTRPKLNSDTNEIVIGNGTVGNGSNTTTIGNSATTDTYIYGNLNVTGQIKLNNAVLSKSDTYAFSTTDNANLLVFTGTTAGKTITLPVASTNTGREITIKNIGTVSLTIASAGGTLISDSTTTAATSLAIGIEPSNNWIKAISDGTNWIILRGLF